MARSQDWKQNVREGVRRENWTLTGPNRVVKVVPRARAASATVGGYITQGRFLVGKTPEQIEKALGLPHGFLKSGARIYSFKRLPMVSEYDYELTTQYPGGLAFNPVHSDPMYLPGHHAIQQWQIKPGIQIPVDQTNFLELGPGQRFPYTWLT